MDEYRAHASLKIAESNHLGYVVALIKAAEIIGDYIQHHSMSGAARLGPL
jgi:hypothetical protein